MSKALLLEGDARAIPAEVAAGSVHCVVTSSPYWGLRDYGVPASTWGDGWVGCLGQEPTPAMFVVHMVEVAREIRRVLRDDGTLWLNIGDSYQNAKGQAGGLDPKQPARRHGLRPNDVTIPGLKPKDLVGIPWMLAFALRADGWYLRQEEIWAKGVSYVPGAEEEMRDRVYRKARKCGLDHGNAKKVAKAASWFQGNPMPSSVSDRCSCSHESLFLLTKSRSYFYDIDAIREPATSTGGNSFGKQDHSAIGTMAQSRKLKSAAERNNPAGRNRRSVWAIPTQSFKEAHFAVFPKNLVIPCIKAGTSEKGCCPECGASWKRITERVREFASGSGRSGNMPVGKNGADMQGGGETLDIRRGPVVSTITTAWIPSCRCNAGEPVPCRVMDPFSGAATTGIAAQQLGRDYIGIERKPEYIEIARRRLTKAAEDLAAPVKKVRPPRVAPSIGIPSLFPDPPTPVEAA